MKQYTIPVVLPSQYPIAISKAVSPAMSSPVLNVFIPCLLGPPSRVGVWIRAADVQWPHSCIPPSPFDHSHGGEVIGRSARERGASLRAIIAARGTVLNVLPRIARVQTEVQPGGRSTT